MPVSNFFKQFIIFRKKWIQSIGTPLLRFINIACFICSVIVLLGLLYQVGFSTFASTKDNLYFFYRFCKYIFALQLLLTYFVNNSFKKTKFGIWSWFLFSILVLPMISDIISTSAESTSSFIYFLQSLGSYYYHLAVLSLFSLLFISSSIIRLMGKRTNPSLIIGISFLFIIFVGGILLKMPHCTNGGGISWIDSFFIATSSVCVTGLTSVDVPTVFTHTGWAVILILIQIGGIGLMTFTSFFALFFMGNTSYYNQLVVKDLIGSHALGTSLRKTMFSVIIFTISIEIIGAIMIWSSVHGTMAMPLKEEVIFSIFHSVSAFCNAGFSTLSGNLGNSFLLHHHSFFYMIISFLVILGGLGFPILVNIKESIVYRMKNLYYRLHKVPFRQEHLKHLYALNSKIVLTMTAVLVVGGTVLFAFLEWNHSLSGFSVSEKIVQSFFNATLPRTAGFMSIDIVHFQIPTILFIMVLMWIGGGAQSTAGGIKVSTIAVSFVNLTAVVRNIQHPKIFRRNISQESIRRSNATIIISLILIFMAVFILTFTESALSLRQIVFECVSALGTVGSSLNATMSLSSTGKTVIMGLMFLGRVGFITFVMGIVKKKKDVYQYPSESIIIN
jgi:Trk-type K+ transport system membrane component